MALACTVSVQGVQQLQHKLVYQTVYSNNMAGGSAKDGYVEDSKEHLLSVTRNIGI